jgi:hypothetical protein
MTFFINKNKNLPCDYCRLSALHVLNTPGPIKPQIPIGEEVNSDSTLLRIWMGTPGTELLCLMLVEETNYGAGQNAHWAFPTVPNINDKTQV